MIAPASAQILQLPQRWQLEEEFLKWRTGHMGHGRSYKPRWPLWEDGVGAFYEGQRAWLRDLNALSAERNHLAQLWLSGLHTCPPRPAVRQQQQERSRSFSWGT